jgi:hypothetical protein
VPLLEPSDEFCAHRLAVEPTLVGNARACRTFEDGSRATIFGRRSISRTPAFTGECKSGDGGAGGAGRSPPQIARSALLNVLPTESDALTEARARLPEDVCESVGEAVEIATIFVPAASNSTFAIAAFVPLGCMTYAPVVDASIVAVVGVGTGVGVAVGTGVGVAVGTGVGVAVAGGVVVCEVTVAVGTAVGGFVTTTEGDDELPPPPPPHATRESEEKTRSNQA